MKSIRTLILIAISLTLLPRIAPAQTLSDFENLSEGFAATTLVTPAGTFQDLVLDAQGTPGTFYVDDASATLAGLSRFTAPNVLAPGGYVPGGALASTPVKSFRILLTQPSTAIRIGLFLDSLPQGNRLYVSFMRNGQMGFVAILYPTGQGWVSRVLGSCNDPLDFDEIQFLGDGDVDGGRFRCAIDTLVIGNVPCGAPSTCVADVIGGCPCGNQPNSQLPAGCAHSLGQGGSLWATGIASLTVDEVVLHLDYLPPFSTGILAQSSSLTTGAIFGDGILCLGTPVSRVLSRAANGMGHATYPTAGYPYSGELPLSVRAGVTTPGTRSFQFVYRNAATFCTTSTFNVTNGTTITWAP